MEKQGNIELQIFAFAFYIIIIISIIILLLFFTSIAVHEASLLDIITNVFLICYIMKFSGIMERMYYAK